MELKDWVKAARKHAGKTIEQLADELGRSKAAAGFWEKGATTPSYAQVRKISEITGYPMPGETLTTATTSIAEARRNTWPFPRIDREKFLNLEPVICRQLENAILATAGDLDVDIRVTRKGKSIAA